MPVGEPLRKTLHYGAGNFEGLKRQPSLHPQLGDTPGN
jgi:hypothetical protein